MWPPSSRNESRAPTQGRPYIRQTSEPRPDPEGGLEIGRVLEVEALGEVPVEVEAEELGGDAEAVGGDGVLKPLGLAVVETEALELVVPGAADIEEQHAANVPEGDERRGEQVDQRKAELRV